ncbi:MAG TPA: YqgE/AlgH family protein [Rhizomicrobium sp.]|nr:YqgE/AlgH family protein [Rhizomicrobium sp.]
MAIRGPSKTSGFLQGKFLIALPGMPDPRFERTVVMMCAHSDAEGAMGLIINKPLENMSMTGLLSKLGIPVSANRIETPVLFGGPVETQQGLILHSSEFSGSQSSFVTSEISLTGTMDVLHAIAGGRGPHKAAFALGYAGWEAGQLENELRGNGWIYCDSDAAILFDLAPEAKWAAALAKLGISPSNLSSQAGRA